MYHRDLPSVSGYGNFFAAIIEVLILKLVFCAHPKESSLSLAHSLMSLACDYSFT